MTQTGSGAPPMTADAPQDAVSNCPQAWHGGLPVGLLVECRFPAKHRGWHRDESGDLAWGGKLTQAEKELAAGLRERVRAVRT